LVQRAGWPSIFLINLPLGLLALALGVWGIPERRHPQHAALDPAGQLLSIVALGALSYGLIAIGEHGLLAPVTLLALGVAAAGLILFGIVERRVVRPLLPLDLFADRRFGMFNLASFVLGFTAYASLFFLSLFFQQAQGHSAAQAGSQLAPQFLLMGVVSLLFGRLVAHLGLHAALVLGYALAGIALCAMARFEPATSRAFASAVLVLLGIGMGLAVPATGMAVMASAPVERAGIASATMNALRQAGMSLGIALLGSLMGQRAVQHFAVSAQAAGQRGLVAQARELILQPSSMHATPQTLAWYRSAMASGFGWAMAVAGALVLLAALGLYRQRAPA
jgi:MFS family permease